MLNEVIAAEPDIEEFPHPQIELIDSDGEPLETEWHRYAMNLLIESVDWFYRDRDDYFAGGDMFIYFSEKKVFNKDFRGPDFFFVWGVKRQRDQLRRYYVVWQEEGHYPDVIIELMSPSTTKIDLTEKKDLYRDVFKTGEYFCYDPSAQKLVGWRRLVAGTYEPIQPDATGRLESKELGLFLGTWPGSFVRRQSTWLRFFTPDGQMAPTFAEAAAQQAEQAQQQAKRAQQQTEEERRRAEAALAELAKLKAQLQSGEQKNGSPA